MQPRLDNVQGNVLGGFNKDFQDFIFLEVTSRAEARKWVGSSAADFISTSRRVIAYNNSFKRLVAEGVPSPERVIPARWANVAFSFRGLEALGWSPADFGDLGAAFTGGMASRSALIGDVGTSDPQQWDGPFDPAHAHAVHAILLVAADNAADLAAHSQAITTSAGFSSGFAVLDTVRGRTRMDNPLTVGHEHFGFKDGVSQPGMRGIDPPDDGLGDPDQGHPGQDLLWPGEFVLGYPTQIPTAKPGHDGPNPDKGPVSTAGESSWTADGSFLVFRRLQQDVPAFDKQIYKLAAQEGVSADVMGAKLVGRYKSGCPLEVLSVLPFNAAAPDVDPGTVHPELAASDTLNNAFEYADDVAGTRCPLGAHIRKAYPRDGVVLIDSGAHRAFAGHYWEAYEPRTYISATNLGPMGWAIPAAVGVQIAKPDRRVAVITGDGCMQMHGMEIQTAARYDLPIIYLVLNNGALGNVWLRAHQYGPLPSELTSIPDHDWAGFARALGAEGFTVTDPAALTKTFEQALASGKTALIDVKTDKDCPTPVYDFAAGARAWSFHE